MNVLIIVDNFLPQRTAAAVRVSSFATAIKQSGRHQVSLVAGSQPGASSSTPLTIHKVSRPSDTKVLSFAAYILRLVAQSIIRMKDHDVVLISVPLYELLLLTIPAVVMRKKVILDLRDSPFFIDYYGYLKRKLPSFVARYVAKLITFLIVRMTKISLKLSTAVMVANQQILHEAVFFGFQRPAD